MTTEQDAMERRIAQLERDRASRTRALLSAEEEVMELRAEVTQLKYGMQIQRNTIDELERRLAADPDDTEAPDADVGES